MQMQQQPPSPSKLRQPSQPGPPGLPGQPPVNVPKSTDLVASLPLEKFLYFDYYYSFLFFIAQYLIYIYKGFRFYYPPAILAIEVVSLSFLFVYQYIRINFGTSGNRLESTGVTFWFLALTIPAIIGFVFYLRLQTYVILLDTILAATSLVFILFEILCGLIALLRFRKYEKIQ